MVQLLARPTLSLPLPQEPKPDVSPCGFPPISVSVLLLSQPRGGPIPLSSCRPGTNLFALRPLSTPTLRGFKPLLFALLEGRVTSPPADLLRRSFPRGRRSPPPDRVAGPRARRAQEEHLAGVPTGHPSEHQQEQEGDDDDDEPVSQRQVDPPPPHLGGRDRPPEGEPPPARAYKVADAQGPDRLKGVLRNPGPEA